MAAQHLSATLSAPNRVQHGGGFNGPGQLSHRQGCCSKIRLQSEVLSVSVNQGAAKWLKPSISALGGGCEILLHDS